MIQFAYQDTYGPIHIPVPIGAEKWNANAVTAPTQEAENSSDFDDVYQSAAEIGHSTKTLEAPHASGSRHQGGGRWGFMPLIERFLSGEKSQSGKSRETRLSSRNES